MEIVYLACNSTFFDITPVKWRIVKKMKLGALNHSVLLAPNNRTSVRTEFEAHKIEKQLSKTGNKKKTHKCKNLEENCSCYITLPPQSYLRRVQRTTGGKELKKYSLGLYRVKELLRLEKTSKVKYNL